MRLANRVIAALLSLAVACAGVLLIIEVIAARLGRHAVIVNWHVAYNWAARTAWISSGIRVTAGVLIVLGLLLLIAELKPARVSRLAANPSRTGAADIDTSYTRRGVAAAIRSAVTDVDGIRDASVTVTRRKITIEATAAAPHKPAARTLREPVTTAARQRLAALSLRHAPALSAHVDPGSR
jgi:hypothetical protein